MTRYIILVYVRPEGSESHYYDPSTITVTATDDENALAVAEAVIEERGHESDKSGKHPHSIIRREPIQ